MTTATFTPAEGTCSPENLPTGALIRDSMQRTFMIIRKPGAQRGYSLVRLCAPTGFYDAESKAPFTLFSGTVTLEND